MNKNIQQYNRSLLKSDQDICNLLMAEIEKGIKGAERKVWHGHPVWFLDGNPIVGYSKLKDSVQLLFWSGQTFKEAGLQPTGTFKAAEARYTNKEDIDTKMIASWLKKAQAIQWDYKNIVKRKGKLVRLI